MKKSFLHLYTDRLDQRFQRRTEIRSRSFTFTTLFTSFIFVIYFYMIELLITTEKLQESIEYIIILLLITVAVCFNIYQLYILLSPRKIKYYTPLENLREYEMKIIKELDYTELFEEYIIKEHIIIDKDLVIKNNELLADNNEALKSIVLSGILITVETVIYILVMI